MTRFRNETGDGIAIVRIALVGNIANNFYREARALAGVSDIEAVCFVERSVSGPNTEQPFSDPLSSEGDSPIAGVRYVKPMFGIPRFLTFLLFLPVGSLRRFPGFDRVAFDEISAMDLVLVSGGYIMLAPKFSNVYVIRPTGGDLTVAPALNIQQYWSLFGSSWRGFRRLLLSIVHRKLYLGGYARSSGVAVTELPPYTTALRSIRYPIERVFAGIPLAIDTGAFRRVTRRSELLPTQVGDEDFVVFMPSRIMMRDSPIHRRTGQWKASEVGILGFHLFLESLEKAERERIWLCIPDRTLSNEINLAKEIIRSLDLESKVVWISGSSKQGLTRKEMIPLYSRAAATLDDFGVGWYGSIVVEAAACESPIVTYVRGDVLAATGNPPLLVAKTPEQVALRLRSLYDDPEFAQQVGRASRDWVCEFHSDVAVRSAYAAILSSMRTS